MGIVEETVRDIKSLKIQGASNVRKKGVNALVKASLSSKASDPKKFRNEFLKNIKKLFFARPTEPELRTALRIFKKSISDKNLSVEEMKKILKKVFYEYEGDRKKSIEKMSRYGSELIKKNAVVLTICHSSTVVNVLKKARKKIKHVYCCETRPLFQGRITARELSKAGISTTLIVDNAASTVLKECDYFFSGADAILADGDVINKIGTNQLSIVAKKYDTKHYVFSSTHKFEPSSFFGKDTPIEERSGKEVFEKKVSGLKIANPAFDRTDSSLIEGIVCEKGIFPPQVLSGRLFDSLNLLKKEKDFLKL